MIKEALAGSEKIEAVQKSAGVKPTALRPALVRNIGLTGEIKNEGPFEIAPETTINRIINHFGGGAPLNKEIKAVQFGGETGLCLGSPDFGLTLDEALRKTGFGGKLTQIVVIPEGTNMVELARDSVGATIDGLCGKCIPCREGTKRVQELLDKMLDGYGEEEDIELLDDLVDAISYTSLCRLGKVSINAVESTLRFFRDEYISMVTKKSKEIKANRIKNSEDKSIMKQAQIA